MPPLQLVYLLTCSTFLFLCIIKDPSWGLYLNQLIYLVQPWGKWWGKDLPQIRWVYIIFTFICLSYLFRITKYSQNKIFSLPNSFLFITLFCLMAMTSLYAVYPEEHEKLLYKQFTNLLFYFLFLKVIDSNVKLERAIWGFVVGVFYSSFYGWQFGRTGDGRLENVGPIDSQDANDLAAIFVAAIPILLAKIIFSKNYLTKLISLLFIAFIANGIVLANSRGSLLGLSFSMIIFCTNAYRVAFDRKIKLKIYSIIIICVIGFLYLADDYFWKRMETIQIEATGEKSRIDLWRAAIYQIPNYPYGTGALGFNKISAELPDINETKAIHNTYIQVLFEYGAIGFTIFILILIKEFNILFYMIKMSKQKQDQQLYALSIGICCSLAGFLFCSIFLDRFYTEALYYLFAYTGALYNINKPKNT